MKRVKQWGLIGVGALAVLYIVGTMFYSGRFQANTLYAGSDISHMTVEAAKQRVLEEMSDDQLTLVENGQTLGEMTWSNLYPNFDPAAELNQALSEQQALMWGQSLVKQQTIASESLSNTPIDQKLIAKELETIGIFNQERTPTQDASIKYDEATGFTLVPESIGSQLDPQALQRGLVNAVQNEETSLELNQFYTQPEIKQDNQALQDKINQVKALSKISMTYTMSGEEVTIPQTEIEKWIYFNEAGEAYLDPASVRTYIGELDDQYASLYQYREFQSTLQGIVTIQPQIYGWTFDYDKEVEALMADVYAGQTVKRAPHYMGNIFNNDITQKDDIGDSHVEIDLLNQMLYIYLEGELALATEVVTGMPPLMETIPGAWNILYKETNATLRGYNPQYNTNYATPVSYWVPFDWEGMGIHDAAWQGTFGGNVWTYAGSNGCINIPSSVMPTLFDLVETNMPVIVF